ncbi:hypothetical protein, partial [Kistimonas scapharcae]|uniref:hypothetical protein n=1 Tax=Kistimonas scapharcae TaxID=1036133 RepID=UPI0031EA8D45
DIAGGVLRNRDAKGMWKAANDMRQAMMLKKKDPEAYKALVQQVHDMGLIGQRVSQEILQNLYGNTYTTGKAQKALDYLFHLNFQEWWTEYTRITNAHVANQTLKRWAEDALAGDAKAKKYLGQLNVTAEEVRDWDGKTLTLEEQAEYEQLKADGIRGDRYNELHALMKNRRAVQDALTRFVEESVVRPNAAHRPAWASDPRYMLIWHLKSFFYSYGKMIILPFLKHLHEQIAATKLPANATMATKIKLYG